MAPDLLYDIIDLCYSLDKIAVKIYSDLSGFYSGKEKELSQFWGQMSKEEKEHVVFWEGLLALAQKGMIPQLFDEPVKIKTQLEDIKNKTLELIDIDNFKAINDTYGHQQGDYVLTEVARHIEASLRKSDICGRYGGEEFIVFLPSVGQGENCRLAEKIRTTIQKLKPADISLTVSIGCSGGQIQVTADADQAVNELIKTADQFLYKAKSLGKNQVIHKQNE